MSSFPVFRQLPNRDELALDLRKLAAAASSGGAIGNGQLYDRLRAMIPSLQVGQRVSSDGRSVPGDGGQGTWTLLSGSYTDDDGSVLVERGYGITASRALVRDPQSKIDPQWYGADASGTNDSSPAIVKAVAAANTQRKAMRLDGATYRLASNVAITCAIAVIRQGEFLPQNGVVVSVSNAISAAQLATPFNVSLGGTFQISSPQTIYANWFSGGDVGAQWTTMINSCFIKSNHHRTSRGPLHFRLVGVYAATTALDCTSLSPTGLAQKLVLDFSGSFLTCATALQSLIDLTGSNTATVKELSIEGLQSGGVDQCYNGVLMSRDEDTNPASPANAAHNRLVDVMIIGYWKTAAFQNIGSEVNEYINCWFENDSTTAPYGMLMTHVNTTGVTSPFGVTPGNGTPPTTSTGANFYGLRVYAPAVTDSAIYIAGFDNINMPDPFVVSGVSPHLAFDQTTYGTTGFYSPQFYPHPISGNYPTNCVEIRGANGLTDVHIRFRTVACTTNVVYVVASPTIAFCSFIWSTNDTFDGGDHAALREATWTDCDIIARGALDPTIKLSVASSFSGRIVCGKPASLTCPGQAAAPPFGTPASMRGIVQYTLNPFQGVELAGGPMMNNRAAPPPSLFNRKGVHWISDGTALTGARENGTDADISASLNAGDSMYSYLDQAGNTYHVRIVNISLITPAPA